MKRGHTAARVSPSSCRSFRPTIPARMHQKKPVIGPLEIAFANETQSGFVVDDHRCWGHEGLVRMLEKEPEFQITGLRSFSVAEVFRILPAKPAIVLLDVDSALKRAIDRAGARRSHFSVIAVVVTAGMSDAEAIQLVQPASPESCISTTPSASCATHSCRSRKAKSPSRTPTCSQQFHGDRNNAKAKTPMLTPRDKVVGSCVAGLSRTVKSLRTGYLRRSDQSA